MQMKPTPSPTAKAKRKSWRDVVPIHPAAELFPLMSPDELRELGEDIKKNGLLTPIVVWSPNEGSQEQFLLDGRNRVAAMEVVGIKVALKGRGAAYSWRGYSPADFLYGTAECGAPGFDPYEYVLSANIHRRHLNAEQKRELIAKLLKAKPEVSNRKIAKQVKADDKTVATVRRELDSTAEIPQLDNTTGADGKARTTKRKRRDVDDFLAEQRATRPYTFGREHAGIEGAVQRLVGALVITPEQMLEARRFIAEVTNRPVKDGLAETLKHARVAVAWLNEFIKLAEDSEAMTATQRKRFTVGLKRMVESKS
jgi:hypothetical protein